MPIEHPFVHVFGTRIKSPQEAAEDRNLNEISIRKAIN